MHKITIFLLIFAIFASTLAKRRTGSRNWQFEARPGMGNLVLEGEEEDDDEAEDGMTSSSSWTESADDGEAIEQLKRLETTPVPKINNELHDDKTIETAEDVHLEQPEEEQVKTLIDQAVNMTYEEQLSPFNETELWRNLSLLPEAKGKKVFWIDATFKAVDLGMNFSELAECATWRRFWNSKSDSNKTVEFQLVKAENRTEDDEANNELMEYEIVDDISRLGELIPSAMAEELLENEDNDAVGILFEEICAEHERDFFFNTPEDAKAIGIGNDSIICEPFRVEFSQFI